MRRWAGAVGVVAVAALLIDPLVNEAEPTWTCVREWSASTGTTWGCSTDPRPGEVVYEGPRSGIQEAWAEWVDS